MIPEPALLQFVDFYLSAALSKKNIELLKLDLIKKTKKIEDPLLKEVALIRAGLELLNKKKKSIHHFLQQRPLTDKTRQTLFMLAPQDCFILATQVAFRFPEQHLSLALHMPIESIHFRRKQLESQLNEDGLKMNAESFLSCNPETRSTEVKSQISFKRAIQGFQNLPLFIRFTIETSAILFSLLALLWIIPEIRNRYETSIQKKINDYLIESSLVDSPAPEGTSKEAKIITPNSPEVTDTPEEEETSKSSSIEPTTTRRQPKVNEGETWRFSFTGSSTHEIEAAIQDTIQKLATAPVKPLTVPGGIQFDFVLPTDQVIPLKSTLEQKVATITQRSSNKANPMSLANLSWYKKKNMGTRKIPSAHVQIIIWISTL